MSLDKDSVYKAWCKRNSCSNHKAFSKDAYDCLKLGRREGFENLFLSRLDEARKVDPKITKTEIFDRLNNTWFRITGEYRYSNYDSFRRRHKRSIKALFKT